MRRIPLAVIGILLLASCTTPTDLDIVRAHYKAEAAARMMQPKLGLAMLYLLPMEGQSRAVALRLDGQPAVYFVPGGRFFVFCLPPGKHRLEYVGDLVTTNQEEFVTFDSDTIYARRISSENIREIPVAEAKALVALRQLGPEPVHSEYQFPDIAVFERYWNSPYRCTF